MTLETPYLNVPKLNFTIWTLSRPAFRQKSADADAAQFFQVPLKSRGTSASVSLMQLMRKPTRERTKLLVCSKLSPYLCYHFHPLCETCWLLPRYSSPLLSEGQQISSSTHYIVYLCERRKMTHECSFSLGAPLSFHRMRHRLG